MRTKSQTHDFAAWSVKRILLTERYGHYPKVWTWRGEYADGEAALLIRLCFLLFVSQFSKKRLYLRLYNRD